MTKVGGRTGGLVHATFAAYTHYKCRCARCRKFWTDYTQTYRKRRIAADRYHCRCGETAPAMFTSDPAFCRACDMAAAEDLPHGHPRRYSNGYCRCDECTEAHQAAWRSWYRRTRPPSAPRNPLPYYTPAVMAPPGPRRPTRVGGTPDDPLLLVVRMTPLKPALWRVRFRRYDNRDRGVSHYPYRGSGSNRNVRLQTTIPWPPGQRPEPREVLKSLVNAYLNPTPWQSPRAGARTWISRRRPNHNIPKLLGPGAAHLIPLIDRGDWDALEDILILDPEPDHPTPRRGLDNRR